MTLSIPSRDPANNDSLAGLFKEVLKKYKQNTDGMLPAIVESYDRTSNRAKVKPLIQVVTAEGGLLSRDPIASVPVLQLGGGGFMISFPLAKGDLGWIDAADRDLSLFLQNYAESKPNTYRMHSFEDSRFIPDIMKDYTIDAADESGMVIQYKDASTKIVLKNGSIELKAPSVPIEGDVNIEGDLAVSGNITATGGITADGTITGETGVIAGVAPNTVSLLTHTHPYTDNGSPLTTSAPTPGS